MDYEENWTQKLMWIQNEPKKCDIILFYFIVVLILRTALCYQNVLGTEEDAPNGQSSKATGILWVDKVLKQHLLTFLKKKLIFKQKGRERERGNFT